MKSIVVLASGNGTNFQAILESIGRGEIKAKVNLLMSDKREAYVLQRAKENGIPSIVIKYRKENPEEFFNMISLNIKATQPDLIVLAGFNRILPESVISNFHIINIHPALLPCFGGKGYYGMRVHQAVLESGAKFSGCTVHFVTGDVDGGPIILQRIVSIEDGDTPESLAEKIHIEEHKAIVDAIKIVLEGRYSISGKRVLKL